MPQIAHAVKMMFTDPRHLRVEDPGSIEGNVVFTYLDAFDTDKVDLQRLQRALFPRRARRLKRLTDILIDLIEPMRKRRNDGVAILHRLCK
jgi:tryptophanyl-tRNA synthetase